MKISFFIFMLLGSFCAFSSTGDVLYYDSSGELVSEDEAYYYRSFELLKPSGRYKVTDYYMDGQVAKYGYYLTPDFKVKDGPFTYYYPDGQTKAQGNYTANLMVGEWVWWYPDGNVMQEVMVMHTPTLPPNEVHLVKSFWNENSQQLVENGNGHWVNYQFDDNHDRTYYKESEGRVFEGTKEGKWIGYDMQGQKIYQENYRKGLLVKGESYVDGEEYKYRDSGTAPVPSGGIEKFYNFIINNLQYPLLAASTNIEGRVLVQFEILPDGSIDKVKAIKGLGWGCDEEAERLVKAFGKWEPRVQRGQVKKSTMVIPIGFHL